MASSVYPFSSTSLHRASLNPVIFTGMMKAAIRHELSDLEIVDDHLTADTLYRNISYPAISEVIYKLHALLLVCKVNAPDIRSNAVIRRWSAGSHTVMTISRDQGFIIKYPRSDDSQSQDRVLFEFYIGTIMNRLRSKLPHFACTLGLLKVDIVEPDENEDKLTFVMDSISGDAVSHIVQERIEGKSLASTLSDMDSTKFYTTLLQLLFALQKAQDKSGFVHNALYPENVIMRSTDISSVSFQLRSQIFQIDVDQYIPTVIDFSSARVTHKGFGVSYLTNPTIFSGGKDMCKLISSCLARLATREVFAEVKWINGFFGNWFDVGADTGGDPEDVYTRWHIQCKGFDLTDDNPISSLSPMDFINWFRQQNGELFNKLVNVKSRAVREKRIIPAAPKKDIESDIELIRSGVIKAYILDMYKQTYISSNEEKDYDAKLLEAYNNYLTSNPGEVYTVNYNFPLDRQYNKERRIDYLETIPALELRHELLQNYILFLRFMETIGLSAPTNGHAMSIQQLQSLFTEKDLNQHNLDIIQNLPLYKLYQAARVVEGMSPMNGGSIVLMDELPLQIVRQFYPACRDYIDSVFTPAVRTFAATSEQKSSSYYPPHTLEQIQVLSPDSKPSKPLVDLVVKSFFGAEKDRTRLVVDTLTEHVRAEHDDVQIYIDLRKFYTPAIIDRGNDRARDITRLFNDLPPVKVKSYLDFGGGDGEISTAVASLFDIEKEFAFSADIDRWFGMDRPRPFTNVTYLTLKEDQPIPLPDQSIDMVTCFQVLHHIKNIGFVLGELKRICKRVLIIREHDCRNSEDAILIDIEHGLFMMCMEPNPRVKYLNDYEAWYRSRRQWSDLISEYGFREIPTNVNIRSNPTRYFYGVFVKHARSLP